MVNRSYYVHNLVLLTPNFMGSALTLQYISLWASLQLYIHEHELMNNCRTDFDLSLENRHPTYIHTVCTYVCTSQGVATTVVFSPDCFSTSDNFFHF